MKKINLLMLDNIFVSNPEILLENSVKEYLNLEDLKELLAPETFVQLAGVNPYSQPKSIRTLSRRSFVQNDILPAGRKSAGN